jgi:sugar lactone lactonase YvrE
MPRRTPFIALSLGLALLLAACTPPAPQLGNLLVDIAGLPPGVDANVTVNGPDAFSQDLTGTELLADLAPGDYTVTVGTITTTAITEYTPVDTNVNVIVIADQTATATISYSTTLGSLQIDVTGLAPDANADINVTGPHGFSANLGGATTLTGLTPGTYDLSAETVRSSSPIVDSIFDVSGIDASVEVDSGATAGATVDYEQRAGTGALWVPNNQGTSIAEFQTGQMAGSSADPPATIVSGFNATGAAFDAQGNLWAGSDVGTIIMYSQDQLATSDSPTPAVTISSDGDSVLNVRSLAFDSGGNLWAPNAGNDRLEMFTPAQLASDGSPTPTIILQDDGGGSLSQPTGIAFDASGNLWVGNQGNNTVVGFSPAQLSVSSAPTPFATLSDNGGSLTAVRYLTFDADGNLWVSNSSSDTISKYTPAQQVTGAPVPDVMLTGDGTHLDGPEGMVFDNSGNMWVVNFESDTLERLTPTQYGASGSPVPGVILGGSPAVGFSQPAFNPPAAGLPIVTP